MGGRARRRTAALLLLFAAALAGRAQEATNRDRSDYTDLRDPGYPPRTVGRTVAARDAALREGDIVLGVVAGGEARAYPVDLMWGPEQEVLNDTLGGRPIAPTWCPLAHSGSVYDRTLDDRTLELGNRGIDHGALVMYDRATGSWWSQIVGASVRGPLQGRRLGKLPSLLTTWGRWRALHPSTTVYVDTAAAGARPRFSEESFARMTLGGGGPVRNEDWIVGIEGRQAARAWLVRRLAGPRVVNDAIEDAPLVVLLAGDDVTVRVFSRRLGDRTLTFLLASEDRLQDRETRSLWDATTGRAISGPLAARELTAFVATPALWYAWRAYRPDTSLWNEITGPAAPRP